MNVLLVLMLTILKFQVETRHRELSFAVKFRHRYRYLHMRSMNDHNMKAHVQQETTTVPRSKRKPVKIYSRQKHTMPEWYFYGWRSVCCMRWICTPGIKLWCLPQLQWPLTFIHFKVHAHLFTISIFSFNKTIDVKFPTPSPSPCTHWAKELTRWVFHNHGAVPTLFVTWRTAGWELVSSNIVLLGDQGSNLYYRDRFKT